MKFGFGYLSDKALYREYRRRIDPREVLAHYGAENVSERINSKDGTTELIHSCLLDTVEPHHAHGDAKPSASMNIEHKMFNCILPGAWVMTPEGGCPIEELRVGDLVLTGKGRYRRVLNTFSRQVEEEVFKITPTGQMSFTVTGEHKLLSAKKPWCPSCCSSRECSVYHRGETVQQRQLIQTSFECSRSLTSGSSMLVYQGLLEAEVDRDFLEVPYKRTSSGRIHKNNNLQLDKVSLTEDFWRFVGYYLAEGSCLFSGLSLCFHEDEQEYIEDVCQISREVFGIEPVHITAESKNYFYGKADYVEIRSVVLSELFRDLFNTGSSNKLLPTWVLTLPRRKLVQLLKGLMRGDGSFTNSQCELQMTARGLVYQIWQVLVRLGELPRLHRQESTPFLFSSTGESGIGKPTAFLSWYNKGSKLYAEVCDTPCTVKKRLSRVWESELGEKCSPILRCNSEFYEGTVYDIEVEEDHTFVVEGVVSSNCYSYWGGGIFNFMLKMEKKDDFTELIPILKPFLTGPEDNPETFKQELERIFSANANVYSIEIPSYSEAVLSPWMKSHPYLREVRGISVETSSKLKIGYDPVDNRIIFPHFWRSKLVGWQGRSIPSGPYWPQTEPEWPKYKSTLSFPKSSTLYNYDRASEFERVIVVESPMSVAKAYEYGIENIVATFGAKVTEGQLSLLRDFEEVLVWMDSDGAGYQGEKKIVKSLYQNTRVRVIEPDLNKDLADYTESSEVEEKIEDSVPALFKIAAYTLEERTYARRISARRTS